MCLWHASNVAPMWHLFSAKCGTDLLRGALLARFVLIMGINAQRHIDRGVSCEILNLFDVQPALKQPRDVGMSELVRMNVEIQRADNLGVRRGRPKVVRIINRAVFNHLQQTLEAAFGKRFSIFHVQHIKALCAFALLYKLCKQRGRYRNIPDCGRGLEGVADGRLRVCEQRIVPNMNHTRGKINVRPHQPAKLSAPHTGLKCQQAEKICPRPSCRVQKALRLFSGERLPALLCRRFAKLPGLAILQSGCYPRLH